MDMKRDLAQLGFEMKLPQKDWMSKVVSNALGVMHHRELNHIKSAEANKIEKK